MSLYIINLKGNTAINEKPFYPFFQVFNNTLYWRWLRDEFVSSVYAGAWYNGHQENQSIYIGDKRSVLVGMPRVRQLRIKPGK